MQHCAEKQILRTFETDAPGMRRNEYLQTKLNFLPKADEGARDPHKTRGSALAMKCMSGPSHNAPYQATRV